MFIVIFHMFYLLGKYVFDNCAKKASTMLNGAAAENTMDQHVLVGNEIQRTMDDTRSLAHPVKFSPPAYIQRYLAVVKVLSDPKYGQKLRKIVDFGCSELGFLPYLKNLQGVKEILFVDVDRQVLLLNKNKAIPLVSDYLQQREGPLKMELCAGSVVHNDKKLEKTDAVVCIELIEHLYEHTLLAVPSNIFGYIQPKVVVITTPNEEFNVLFPGFSGFRHPDHKFEWTRRQFEDWANSIVERYPNYSVTFEGICYGPEDTKHLGACTQMAIFEKKQESMTQIIGVEGLFETVETIVYPFTPDKRTDTQKVIDEAKYYINFVAYRSAESPNVVDLTEVQMLMKKYSISLEILSDIMSESGYIVENRETGPVIILPEEESNSDDMLREDDSDLTQMSSEDLLSEMYDTSEVHIYDIEGDDIYDIPEDDLDIIEHDLYENWNEESIVIVENRTVSNRENSYLFDGEHSTYHHRPSSAELAIVADIEASSPRIGSTAESEEFQLHVSGFTVSNATEANNAAATDDDSVMMPDAANSSLLSATQDLSDATPSFQPYLSVSRCSTSPGLLFVSELEDSLISQNLLNSTFNKSEITNETTSVAKLAAATLSNVSSLEEKDESSVLDQSSNYLTISCADSNEHESVDSTKTRVLGSDESTEIEPQTMFSYIYDKPQSSSSPRCKKMHVSHAVKRNCLEGDDLISALESYTELNPMEVIKEAASDTDALNGTSQQSSRSEAAVVETIRHRTTSITKDATSAHEPDANRSSSNNSQRELLLGNKELRSDHSTSVNSLRESHDGETAGEENLIKHETDTVDVQRVDAPPHVLSSDDVHNDVAEARLRDGSEDFALPSVSGESSSRKLESTKSGSNGHECHASASGAKDKIRADDGCKSHDEDTSKTVQFVSPSKSDENVGSIAEAKPPSPSFETPPDSWSHEIVDSGYPNSASGQDITPENDLSSIAQDHIPEMESPSVAEAPRLEVLEAVEVENGDLANNNRDDEGNNMMAVDVANDIEGLQPLIDVLEIDLENENDIYVLENDFPMWLLRILDMANPLDFDVQPRRNVGAHREAADADYMDHDEGFDSSSSDE